MLALFRLARKRMNSAADYQKFQQLQGIFLVNYLTGQGLDLKQKKILDLGCGYGGYALALQRRGAEVVGVDLDPHQGLTGIPLVSADAARLPFQPEAFDLVVCSSLIEHLPEPPALLREIFRVLRPGGKVYLSFPPFYSYWGGHQFSPFHWLGEKAALRLNRVFGRYKDKTWVWDAYPKNPASFARAYGAWGLYPLTIGRVEGWIKGSGFALMDESTRWFRLNFARIPVLKEILTWHVQFLLTKV
jgi:SAM-dependent methyltransferase